MKRLLKENWNRAVAVILVLTMVLGLWPMASEVRAETHYSGRLHLEGAQTVSGANHMYLRGTDGALPDLRGDWTPRLTPADDESGVFVNGERLTVGYELVKYHGDVNNVYNWYYLTGFDFSSAGTGTVKVKGSFIISTTKEVVELKEVTFTYNNGTWTESQELDETYEITNCGGGATDIYLYGTSSMPVKNWQTSLTACENGEITFYDSETNETRKLNVDIRRPDHGFYYLVLADKNNGLSATKGDIVSIQGQFYMDDYYVDFVPAKFKFNGSGWSKATDYRQLTFRAINSATGYNDGYNGWFFYLDPSQELPGTEDVTHFTGLKLSVGDGEPFDVRVDKSAHQGTAFLAVSGADVPKNLTENTKIVLHAGKADSDDGSDGIELTGDFTIYANQYGMSTEGFITPISYNALTFTGIDSATGYNDDYNGWFFYLDPSQELPGTEDVTHFTGLKLSVGNGEAFDVRVDKSSNQGTAFLAVPGTCVPKNLTENTKIVLHAGKADSDDGSDGIELTGDFTIYANQYGMSTEGFLQGATVIQTNARLTLDNNTAFGGNENGLYMNTDDKFPTDTTWATKIKAYSYDIAGGVFLNGEKIDAPLIRYADGKLYVGLADAGVFAKDKDKVTIKGTFSLGEEALSYAEVSYYYNGKAWGEQYEAPKPESYKKFSVNEVNEVSGWNSSAERWDIYLNVNTLLPGEGDKISFNSLAVEINGKTIETTMYHASYGDTLFFVIEGKDLPENVKDGTRIVLKAGKALAGDRTTGIELTQDFALYIWKGTTMGIQPTTNTEWQDVTPVGLLRTATFNKDMNAWLVHMKLQETLATESGTRYLELPVKVNGKEYQVKAQQDGVYLMLMIPDSVLPAGAKNATITIPKGAKAVAKAGYKGIQFKEELVFYLFNGVLSEHKFEEMEEIEAKITGLQTIWVKDGIYHLYLRLNKEFPGNPWYERYSDFKYYYNGKKIGTDAVKPDSSNNKFMYFALETEKTGEPKEGDIVKVAAGTVFTCGGYKVTITDDFLLMYNDGVWAQYMETSVKAPEDDKSLWDVARFDKEYIPAAENGAVMFSNENKYNAISSMEPMKDFTISFKAKKNFDDETTPSFGVILRGNAIDDEEPMTETLLYGYVITFSSIEQQPEEGSDEPGIWGGYLQLWKNGENYSLLDQYRVSYVMDSSDHPFFQYDKEYSYQFSIYNITDTCVCIEARVNDKLVMRYYDEAGSDPFDPAVNAGTFRVYAGCPTFITDDIAELSEVISEKEECKVGEKVRVAVTYPSVLEGAEFSVDKEGATIEHGMFTATEAGTYTISGSYNGKKLASKTITVTKEETETIVETSGFPIIPVVITVLAVAAAGLVIAILAIKKRSKKQAGSGQADTK